MVINKAPDKNGRNILGRLGRYASHSELTRKKTKDRLSTKNQNT